MKKIIILLITVTALVSCASLPYDHQFQHDIYKCNDKDCEYLES